MPRVIRVDAEGKREDVDEVPSYTYRLQGDKSVLKDLKDKHDRKIVEVKGILRSSLTGSGLGTTVGRTRITIGSDPNGPRGAEQPLPVLEAIAFEGMPSELRQVTHGYFASRARRRPSSARRAVLAARSRVRRPGTSARPR